MIAKQEKINPEQLVFTTRDIAEVPTPEFFAELRKHRMYVPGWSFSHFYTNPDDDFNSGAIVATAYLDNVPVAVAIINLEEGNSRIPTIGFFTRVKYRRNGLAKVVGQLVFERYKELGHTKPVSAEDGSFATNWGTAYYICQALKIPACPS